MVIRRFGGQLALCVFAVLLIAVPVAGADAQEASDGILAALHVGVGIPVFGFQGVAVGNSSDSTSYSGGSRVAIEALYDFNPNTRFGMGGYYRRLKSSDDWVANAGGILLGWTWPTRSGLFTQLTLGLGVGKVDVDLDEFEGVDVSTDSGVGLDAGLDFKLFYPLFEIAQISGQRSVQLAPFVSFSSGTTMGSNKLTVDSGFGSSTVDYDLSLGGFSITLGVTTVILR